MATLFLDNTNKNIQGKLTVVGSKSLSNRLLISQALYKGLTINNLSNAADTQVLIKALATANESVNIGHAGTAMRFLTAFFASQENRTVTLTGSSRMQERPIGILVDALRELGANITYTDKEGYPPLLINGAKLLNNKVYIKGNVSSQYISALLLIAPSLPNGLEISIKDKLTSKSYVKMTLALLEEIGVTVIFKDNNITVKPLTEITNTAITVESDWSAVSYYYSLIALSKKGNLVLQSFYENSLQGDKVLMDIYAKLGVKSTLKNNELLLTKTDVLLNHLQLDLVNAPDIAQTIVVTCFALGISCNLTGLHTLKIKETDRLQALKTELEKLGASVSITSDSLYLCKSEYIQKDKLIKTYQDHRMAMAFAPLALRVPIRIEEFDVVKKSYPDFWDDLAEIMQ